MRGEGRGGQGKRNVLTRDQLGCVSWITQTPELADGVPDLFAYTDNENTPIFGVHTFHFLWSREFRFLWWQVTVQLTSSRPIWEHFAAKCVTLLISIPDMRVIFLIIIPTRIFEQVSSLGGNDKSRSLIDTIFIRHYFFHLVLRQRHKLFQKMT